MTVATYTRYELLRTFRNKRFLIFAFGFPLVLYVLIVAPNRHVKHLNGTQFSAPLYFMVGLLAFGTMNAMLSAGARISAERAVGWNRQLRITPLSPRTYFRTKVLTGYAMSLVTIGLLYAAGTVFGVRLPAGDWVKMTLLILVGLIPFAALGVFIGHVVTPESVGPVLGGSTALLAFLGGVWFPISGHGALHHIAEVLPSYWLVQAAHVAQGGSGWGREGWIVVAAWTVGATILARRAYVKDTKKT